MQYHRQIQTIALPMILSSVSIPLLGIVDTAILGHLDSEKYLASVSIGASIINILFWGFGFLRMSTTGLVAQSHGIKNHQESGAHLSRAFMLAIFISLILIALKGFLLPLMLGLMSDGGEPARLANIYLNIRVWASPATLSIYVMVGYFLAIGKTAHVLGITLINQFGNMILDYVFVVIYGYDVAGVAAGSLISEYMAMLYGLFVMKKHFQISLFNLFNLKQFADSAQLKRLFNMNTDIFVRTLCLMFVFAFFTRQSALQGTAILAANAVLLNFFYLASYGLDGYAHAIESISGRLFGQKRWQNLSVASREVFMISWLIAAGISVIYVVFGSNMIQLLTDIQTVRNNAYAYLFWLYVIPLISVVSFVYDGLCVGTTQTKIMRNSMLMATFLGYLPIWYILSSLKAEPSITNHYLWLSFCGFFIVRGISIHLLYKKQTA